MYVKLRCWACQMEVMCHADRDNTCPRCGHIVNHTHRTCGCVRCVAGRGSELVMVTAPAALPPLKDVAIHTAHVQASVNRHGVLLRLVDADNPEFWFEMTFSKERLLALVASVSIAEEQYARGELPDSSAEPRKDV
jgi:uncharacterized paraquat-inducible protein A